MQLCDYTQHLNIRMDDTVGIYVLIRLTHRLGRRLSVYDYNLYPTYLH
jgi:hypothetical protein